MTALGMALSLLGGLVVLAAAAGLWLLPDALSRQHAGTKAATLGVALVSLGAAVWAWELAWSLRLLALGTFLVVTLPVASHMLGRAAAQESAREEDLARAPRVGGGPGEDGRPPGG